MTRVVTKALNAGGGVTMVLTQDRMTHGPVIKFPSITQVTEAKLWVNLPAGYGESHGVFGSTSHFARLQRLKCMLAGHMLYVHIWYQSLSHGPIDASTSVSAVPRSWYSAFS